MNNRMNINCLVVGAGPSGLTLGIGLLKQGKSVLIAEKHTESLGFSRALLINSETLKDIAEYGELQELRADSIPVTGVSLYSSGTLISVAHFDPTFHYEIHPIVLPQDTTEMHLRNKYLSLGGTLAPGFEFCLKDQYAQILSGPQKYTLRQRENGSLTNHTINVQCNWLFGCDGIHSTVREYLQIGSYGTKVVEQRYLMDVEVRQWPFTTTGVLHLEMQGGSVSILISHTPPTVRIIAATREEIRSRLEQLDVSKILWDGRFTTLYRIAKSYGRDHAWLVGDAAHSHSPVGGRGMNLGIQEAVALARCIRNDRVTSYEQQRRPIARNWVITNYFVTQLLWSRSTVCILLRAYFCMLLYLYSCFCGQSLTKWIFEKLVAFSPLKTATK